MTLRTLLDDLPCAGTDSVDVLIQIANVVKAGQIYPTGEAIDTPPAVGSSFEWLAILDALNEHSALKLLGMAMKAVAVRTQLEDEFRDIRRKELSERCSSHAKYSDDTAARQAGHNLPVLRDDTTSTPPRFIRLVIGRFVNQWSHIDPARIALFNLWLERLFLIHAETSHPMLMRGSIECGILEWLEFPPLHNELNLINFGRAAPKDLNPLAMAESWMSSRGKDVRLTSRHLWSFQFAISAEDLAVNFRMINHLGMRQACSSAANKTETRRRTYTSHTNPFEPDQDSPLDIKLKHAEQPYLLLSVGRKNILQNTFDQLWQRRRSELMLPLRVRLGEGDSPTGEGAEWLEIGQDLGGVQIEFFNAFCTAAFAPDTGIFQNLEDGGGLGWFRPASLQPLYMFELVGLVLGLAVYNGVTLPIALPEVFYRHLLLIAAGVEAGPSTTAASSVTATNFPDYNYSVNAQAPISAPGWVREEYPLTVIQDGWPMQARSLQSILDLQSEEEIEQLGLDYSFPLEANGLRMSVYLPTGADGSDSNTSSQTLGKLVLRYATPSSETPLNVREEWPGWHLTPSTEEAEPVTAANKEQYVRDYISWLTHFSVAPQLHSFRKGLLQVFEESHALELFSCSPLRLKNLVEGSSHLDLGALRAATRYQGYDKQDTYIRLFWSVLASWPEDKQLRLLKFVTAAERLPAGGSANVMFQISATAAELEGMPGGVERLPTSSTCFGTLFLPRYGSKKMLESKLETAIEWGGVGFGVG